MTSSSIPTTFPSTNSMFRKYSTDSVLTDFLPMQINASSISLPVPYMLSPEGLTMAPYKVQIIQDWPVPQKVNDIQSFLSFANFHHHFIYGYSEITVLLMHLTHKGTPWNFSDECHSTFEALKKAFTTALVLTHWIPDTQITVETDTSDYTLTAVLSITTPDGDLHPIAFHSQTFSAPELNDK